MPSCKELGELDSCRVGRALELDTFITNEVDKISERHQQVERVRDIALKNSDDTGSDPERQTTATTHAELQMNLKQRERTAAQLYPV